MFYGDLTTFFWSVLLAFLVIGAFNGWVGRGSYQRNRLHRENFGSAEDHWYRDGECRGLGPRNYRRSDARIFEDVNDLLLAHGDLDASDVEVEVQDGVVSLKGKVKNRRDKRLAEQLAEFVTGVRDVNNALEVEKHYPIGFSRAA